MTGQTFQQYVRILLYNLFAGLTTLGITTPDNTKTMIAGIVGILANLLWTMYGTRLNGLLEQVKEKTGVVAIEIKTNPEIIKPVDVIMNTSSGITAAPATVAEINNA